MSVSIVRTSKGPMNLSAFCRTETVQMDGKDKYIAFCMMDGGRMVLPLAEGDRLARWIEERAVFDSTVSAPPDSEPWAPNHLTQAQLDSMREYARARDGE